MTYEYPPPKKIMKNKTANKLPRSRPADRLKSGKFTNLNVSIPMAVKSRIMAFCKKSNMGASEVAEVLLVTGLNNEVEAMKGIFLTKAEAAEQIPMTLLESFVEAKVIIPVDTKRGKMFPQRQIMRAQKLISTLKTRANRL